jgi:hypothetical protein
MNNVVDYFTGLPFKKVAKQDYETNDAMTEKYGVYVGNIGNANAIELHTMNDERAFLKMQLDKLNEQFEHLNQNYHKKLNQCLGFFGSDPKIKRLELFRDDLIIDKEGHVWIIYND